MSKDYNKPSRAEAETAVKVLLEYIGDDASREGLKKTPKRVVDSYTELFSGYTKDAATILDTKFFEKANFQDFIMLKNIGFTSICEHHMLPFIGVVDIAYIPNECLIGISKLARIVDVFARRLQIQEKMTVEIAESIQEFLQPLGVAVRVRASHSCMTMRGTLKEGSEMSSMHYTGIFTKDLRYRQDFLQMIGS